MSKNTTSSSRVRRLTAQTHLSEEKQVLTYKLLEGLTISEICDVLKTIHPLTSLVMVGNLLFSWNNPVGVSKEEAVQQFASEMQSCVEAYVSLEISFENLLKIRDKEVEKLKTVMKEVLDARPIHEEGEIRKDEAVYISI
jgi:hypothetical protein